MQLQSIDVHLFVEAITLCALYPQLDVNKKFEKNLNLFNPEEEEDLNAEFAC